MSIGKLTAWHWTLKALKPSLPLLLQMQLDCNSTTCGSRDQGHWPSALAAQKATAKTVVNTMGFIMADDHSNMS